MGCNNCPKTPVLPALQSGEAVRTLVVYTTEKNTVRGRRNKLYPLNQPLVPPGQFPRGKWGVAVRIKGIVRDVEGDSALAVYKEVVRLKELNGEEVRSMDIWLNLNLQWVPRVPNKYQLVTPSNLQRIATSI